MIDRLTKNLRPKSRTALLIITMLGLVGCRADSGREASKSKAANLTHRDKATFKIGDQERPYPFPEPAPPRPNIPGTLPDPDPDPNPGTPPAVTPPHRNPVAPGSVPRYLDAPALTARLGKVFKKESYGYQHCAPPVAPSPTCQNSLFSPNESILVGTFGLAEPGFRQGIDNAYAVSDLMIQYLKVLRSMLDRECIHLVNTELARLSSPSANQNILVKSEDAPSAQDLQNFAGRIFGLEQFNSLKVSPELDDYSTAYSGIMNNLSGDLAVTTRTNTLVNICIAISSDPLVFTY